MHARTRDGTIGIESVPVVEGSGSGRELSPRLKTVSVWQAIRHHPLVAYFALAYTISWAAWLSIIRFGLSSATGLGSGLFVLGTFGPALSGIAVAAATSGRRGVTKMLSRCLALAGCA